MQWKARRELASSQSERVAERSLGCERKPPRAYRVRGNCSRLEINIGGGRNRKNKSRGAF